MENNFVDCKLCNYFKSSKQSFKIVKSFNYQLNKALYNKYSSSQDFFFGKLMNKFVQNESNPTVVKLKDENCFQESEEYFKKVYPTQSQKQKMHDLTQYYKFHSEIPRIYMMPQSQVCNEFHDKKRRLNYYKVKRILHQQQGNQEPLEITEDSLSNSSVSSTPSQTLSEISRFLKSHLIKSFHSKIKNQKKQKDTILEINALIQNSTQVNLFEIEQHSKFLQETQKTEESQIFDQNFIQRLKNMQKGNIKSVDLKKQQDSQQKKTIKFRHQKLQFSKKNIATQTDLQLNIQLKQQESQNQPQKNQIQKKIQISKTTRNLNNKIQFYKKPVEIQIQDETKKKFKKINQLRAQSQSKLQIINPNFLVSLETIYNKIKSQIQVSPQIQQQQLNRYSSQSKLQGTSKLNQNLLFLSPNTVVKLKQTFNNIGSPQFNTKKKEFKEKISNNRNTPKSMQISKDFQEHIHETDRLHKMLQAYGNKQAIKRKSSQVQLISSTKFK